MVLKTKSKEFSLLPPKNDFHSIKEVNRGRIRYSPGILWNERSEPGQDRKVAALRNSPHAKGLSPVFLSSSRISYKAVLKHFPHPILSCPPLPQDATFDRPTLLHCEGKAFLLPK